MIKDISFKYDSEYRKELINLFNTSEWTKTASIPFYADLDCKAYFEGDKIVGAMLYKKFKRKEGGRCTFIVVAPEHKKKGIAKELLTSIDCVELLVDIAFVNLPSFKFFYSLYKLEVIEVFTTKQGLKIMKYRGYLRSCPERKKLF